MPVLARKIIVCAAPDSLIIHPLPSRKDQRGGGTSVKIHYGDNVLSAVTRDSSLESKPDESFEAFGIVGLISVAKLSYLISITRRQHVATIRGYPIYVVTEVALTPCSSYKEAAAAVAETSQQYHNNDDDSDDDSSLSDSESDSDDDDDPSFWADDIGHTTGEREETVSKNGGLALPRALNSSSFHSKNASSSSIAEDVISRRGSYGRFGQSWFSRDGWREEQKRLMGLTGDSKPVQASEEPPSTSDEQASTSRSILPAADGESAVASGTETPASIPAAGDGAAPEDSAALSLLPKLLRTTQMLFGSSRAFYFSYDYDITRSLSRQSKARWNDLPLHKLVDPLYFWNHSVMQPFISLGADALALPLMQGFVGQRSFVVDSNPPQQEEDAKDAMELSDFSYNFSGADAIQLPAAKEDKEKEREEKQQRSSEKKFDITVISRRSVKRAGLRYLRRGVDEDGSVANTVETEQILNPSAIQPSQHKQDKSSPNTTYSFVQLRGSIPLFFTQSPFSLKPVPQIQHSLETNFGALKKHFDGLRQRYGHLQVVNLVEKHGVEQALGTQFMQSVQRLNEDAAAAPDQQVPFEWFDFHAACRGMKFENVALLLEKLAPELEQLGSTVAEDHQNRDSGVTADEPPPSPLSNGQLVREQKGVLRTNCMDCLDRTNVCQSSFAKYMLDAQLKEQGFDMTAQRDQENSWFNTLWADNGDAISKQYASTAAMKGDYTRTRKRDYRGALTDAGLSLTRFFNGVVNDFFLQTTIDFLLGNVTDQIFDEFEANMMTKDPAMSMTKMREQAIDLCQRRVVEDETEEFVGGWTLLAPHDADASLVAPPFEEVVLLLTDAALYLCRFDWNLDKLSSFERVALSHVVSITLGTYILSTVSPMQTDEARNVGFMVSYQPGRQDILRVNTRSLTSLHVEGGSDGTTPATTEGTGGSQEGTSTSTAASPSGFVSFLTGRPAPPPMKRLAFKSLYADTSKATSAAAAANEQGPKQTEMEQAAAIAAEIERLALQRRPPPPPPKDTGAAGAAGAVEHKSIVVRGDIVSLAEARRSTGLLGHLGHSLKKLVWA